MDFPHSSCDSHQTRSLCHCLGIQAEQINAAIVEQDLSTVRGVTKACGAGGGCTSCHRHIKRMLQEHASRQRQQASAGFAIEPLLGCA